MKIAREKTAGFSLVELLIYLGLMILVLAASVNLVLSMSGAYRYVKLSSHIESSAVLVLDRMAREIRDARSVNAASSTLDTSPGVLVLNTTTDAGGAETIGFSLSGGAVHITENGNDLGPLSLPDVSVDNLVFREINTGISQAVKIEMTLSAGSGASARSANFYDTVVLRDSY